MKISKLAKKRIDEIIQILHDLGMPDQQQNIRTALCLLALLDLKPSTPISEASAPLLGITPIMEYCHEHYKIKYAPNTRETFRRQSIHQLMQAGLVVYNPDDEMRATNSPNTVYQVTPELLELLHQHGRANWMHDLAKFSETRHSLAEIYAKPRNSKRIPIALQQGEISLSPGEHNELVKSIVEQFAPIFLHGAALVYVGDTQNKTAFVNTNLLGEMGISFDVHDKFPDLVYYDHEKKWIILIESVTSHGPMDGKRYQELSEAFETCDNALVYVSAFRTRATFAKYASTIAWETEVWIEDDPDHLIHYNGTKFLGPYKPKS